MRTRLVLVTGSVLLCSMGVLVADFTAAVEQHAEAVMATPLRSEAVTPEAAAAMPPLPASMNPKAVEIRALLADERQTVEALQTELATTKDRARALELQRDIQRTKLVTELAILQVQADHAREAGNEALAVEIEQAIVQIQSPPVQGTPLPRPAPVDVNAGGNQ